MQLDRRGGRLRGLAAVGSSARGFADRDGDCRSFIGMGVLCGSGGSFAYRDGYCARSFADRDGDCRIFIGLDVLCSSGGSLAFRDGYCRNWMGADGGSSGMAVVGSSVRSSAYIAAGSSGGMAVSTAQVPAPAGRWPVGGCTLGCAGWLGVQEGTPVCHCIAQGRGPAWLALALQWSLLAVDRC